MKIALVHDYLNQYGGAEKVLEAFTEIFPDAPIFTLIHDKKLFSDKEVYTSFLQKVPFAVKKHRFFPPLMPMAIEKFDLSDYDVVLSDSASFAKGIITKPETLHICYCHTPTRYAWDDSHKYIREFSLPIFSRTFVSLFLNYIRLWDREAAYRVDKFICNSKFVLKRINKYYKVDAKVIYPPVNINDFEISKNIDNYFLIVGRLLPYKRFDLAIQAFNKLGLPLKVVGDGPQRKKLEKIAEKNIEFLGEVKDLKKYYQNCKALIFPQEEDFGIVAIEAMACGRPVIAFKGGGALESVIDGKTGIFFNEQDSDSLIRAVKNFDPKKFKPSKIRQHALKFDKEIFKKKIKDFVEKNYENWN
ncbi:glycosyltransferase [Patescibacteria group bacterium]|nr:glycosyltransferase [Patescibacteria group bacterium]